MIKILFLSLFIFHGLSSQCLAASVEKPNRLQHESSPYLLQHAHNPVDWYPWGEEAFAKAREENKPIFISIGYSTCHWCHVMAHESFENKDIAALLNKHFISVKVDREERPDIDRIYLTASEIIAGYGGWPTTIVSTTELKPFFAGTYIPPFNKQGQPGLHELLNKIVTLWRDDRSSVNQVANEVTALIKQQLSSDSSKGTVNTKSPALSYQHFKKAYDEEFGGFGNAPKFPRTAVFDFLLTYGQQKKQPLALQMVEQSLDRMIRGGIYDQVGGGLHRYSVDAEWQVPHFEKMLYDQGLITNTLIDVSKQLNQKKYHAPLRQTLNFVLEKMQNKQGGFFSAYDADSTRPDNPNEHGEGAYYVWSQKELKKLLSKKQQTLLFSYYNIQPEGNVASDPQNEFTNLNILHAEQSLEDTAASLGIKYETAQRLLDQGLTRLQQQRQQRPLPHLDDKIITSWNALMIRSLARAASLLNDERYLAAAKKAARFIHRHLYDPVSQTLYRSTRNGIKSGKAYLDDYAYLINALTHLYQTSADKQWLLWANNLMQKQIALFYDQNGHGFFDNTSKDKNILFRSKEIYDGSLPSANAVSVENLWQLSRLSKRPDWKALASNTINAFHQQLNELVENYPQMYRSYLLIHQ